MGGAVEYGGEPGEMQLPGILLRGCARMHGDMAEIGDAVEYVDEWMPFVGVAKTKAHFY